MTSLKLSPNLRKRCVPQPGAKESAEELECAKLERVMDVARRSDPEHMAAQAAAAQAAATAAHAGAQAGAQAGGQA